MTNNLQSVLLISRTPSVLETLNRAATAVPGTSIKACETGLIEMNGHASEMAMGSSLVIFETEGTDELELSAIRALAESRDSTRRFVALTDGNLPISAARRLRSAGVDEIVPLPCSDEDLEELLKEPAKHHGISHAPAAPVGRQGLVLAVARARGGIGATTIAVNLAYLLQDRRGLVRKQASKRVALVDLELQFGDVGIFLDVEDQGAMLQIAKSEKAPDPTFVRTAMSTSKCGLSVLSAPAQPVPLDAMEPDKISAILDALQAEYDYVVVDMPQALVPWIGPVLNSAAKILIATDTTVPGVRHARRLIDFYSEESPVLSIEIAVVGENRPMFLTPHQKEACKVLERPLAHWLPHDGDGAMSAIDRGVPVVELRGRSRLSKAFRKMTKSITRSLSAQPATATAHS